MDLWSLTLNEFLKVHVTFIHELEIAIIENLEMRC